LKLDESGHLKTEITRSQIGLAIDVFDAALPIYDFVISVLRC